MIIFDVLIRPELVKQIELALSKITLPLPIPDHMDYI
jgi:hypothetical protein